MRSLAIRSSALVAVAALASASQGAITIYTSQAAFNAATQAQGVDTYTGLSISGTTPSPLNRNAGPYAYVATASTDTFFGAGTAGDPWLSTNLATDSILFNGFGASVSAAGGLFFTSNISGQAAAGDVTLAATDADGTVNHIVVGSTINSFVGFVSTGVLQSVTLASVQPAGGFVWPTAEDFTLGQRLIPAPASVCAFMLAGLAGVRRRR